MAQTTLSPSEAAATPLDLGVRLRLSLMMFLQYFVWGAWFVTFGTYLKKGLSFSDPQVGLAYGTAAIAGMISPFFLGMIADRFFATQHILCALHIAGGALLYYASSIAQFSALYPVLIVYFLCFMPTLALTNSLSFHHLPDPARQFPGIRVLGTIGWIVAGLLIGWLEVEGKSVPMQIAAGTSVFLGISCLLLPHTPPRSGEQASLASILGLDALTLMRQWSFAVFVIGSFLICIPLQFYYSWTNVFLNELHLKNAAGMMTMGQMSEILFMLVMPLFFARLGVKWMLLVGMFCWAARYVLFAFGDTGPNLWMLYIGIILHGICYDFFFVTGQIYVDNKAPVAMRGAAQGFIAFVTLGVGGFIGTALSGWVVGKFTRPGGELHDWRSIWLIPAAGAGLVMLLFAALFRDRGAAAVHAK